MSLPDELRVFRNQITQLQGSAQTLSDQLDGQLVAASGAEAAQLDMCRKEVDQVRKVLGNYIPRISEFLDIEAPAVSASYAFSATFLTAEKTAADADLSATNARLLDEFEALEAARPLSAADEDRRQSLHDDLYEFTG